MARKDRVKILWVSDIHFSHKYAKIADASFRIYLETFIDNAKLTHTSESPYSYVFFTGDLAQSGLKVDYDCFWDMLLKPLLDVFINSGIGELPKVICIPGNHDLNWFNGEFLTEYLGIVKPSMAPTIRSEFLRDKKPDFIKLFSDYIKFLREDVLNAEGGRYRTFFDLSDTNCFKVSGDFRESCLYGHIVDIKRKTIFVLFNTAWFSLGQKFNDLFSAELIKDKEFNEKQAEGAAAFQEHLRKKVLQKKDLITEFSNQVTGVNFLDMDVLTELMDRYPDYLMVSIMHHPINWLNRTEYYASNATDKELNANKLAVILNRADIVLSGHEHIPMHFLPEQFYNRTIHFKSGCFLSDRQHLDLRLFANWFSVLDIDVERGRIHQEKYYFDQTIAGKEQWNTGGRISLPLVKKNDRYLLVGARSEELMSRLKDGTEDQLLAYVNTCISPLPAPEKLEFISGDDAVKIYRTRPETCRQLYVVSHGPDFYKRIKNKEFCEQLEGVLHNLNYQVDVVRFIVLDLFVDGKAKDGYFNTQMNRYSVLQVVVKTSDAMFDNFRHEFFTRCEGTANRLSPKIDRFRKYSELCFVNHIIPYWSFEKLWS